jgi:hypothetical protein
MHATPAAVPSVGRSTAAGERREALNGSFYGSTPPRRGSSYVVLGSQGDDLFIQLKCHIMIAVPE